MLLSLESGVSALEQFQEQLNVIANNIANVNTAGFKQADVSFADTLSNTIGTNSAGSMQVGAGVLSSGITNDFSTPGAIASTGVQSDLAIQGNGFFVVADPSNANIYVTQDGSFTLDKDGYLVTANGMRLQSASGSIQITAGSSSASVSGYSVAANGDITVNLSDGTSVSGGRISLQNFTNPNELVATGNNLYSAPAAAGPFLGLVTPGAFGVGTLETGALEMSNVDLAGQLTDLITTQRAYEASSKVISTSDDTLQTLVNLKSS